MEARYEYHMKENLIIPGPEMPIIKWIFKHILQYAALKSFLRLEDIEIGGRRWLDSFIFPRGRTLPPEPSWSSAR